MTRNEIQFIYARAWLTTHATEYGISYRLDGDDGVRVWNASAVYPLTLHLEDGEWVLNTGPRFHYLHRAVMFMLTEAPSVLSGTAWHLSTFGEPCWKGCRC